jgi:hypothetical protein
LTINPADKDSMKNVIAEIEKFIGKSAEEVVIIKNKFIVLQDLSNFAV